MSSRIRVAYSSEGVVRLLPAFASFAMALACISCGQPDRPTVHVSDSTGVSLVTHSSTARPRGVWAVEDRPIVDIGGDPDGDLYDVRFPRLLSGGRLLFYNGGTCEIRTFDFDGAELTRFGRCGNGPAEFDQVRGVWPWRGDSLLVSDQLQGRLAWYGPNGGLGRSILPGQLAGLPVSRPIGVTDGRLIVRSNLYSPPSIGLTRREFRLASFGLDVEIATDLGVFPDGWYDIYQFQGQMFVEPLIFSSRSAVAVGGGLVFVGLTDDYEVRAYSVRGNLTRIIRRDVEATSPSREDVEWLLRRRLRQVESEEQRRLVRQAYRERKYADRFPGFGVPEWPGPSERAGPSLIVDDMGYLWVFDYYRPGGYANQWTIFDSNGRLAASAVLPAGFVPSHINGDLVAGVWTDSLDLAHVQVYRLAR